jgi:hypothetical protein
MPAARPPPPVTSASTAGASSATARSWPPCVRPCARSPETPPLPPSVPVRTPTRRPGRMLCPRRRPAPWRHGQSRTASAEVALADRPPAPAPASTPTPGPPLTPRTGGLPRGLASCEGSRWAAPPVPSGGAVLEPREREPEVPPHELRRAGNLTGSRGEVHPGTVGTARPRPLTGAAEPVPGKDPPDLLPLPASPPTDLPETEHETEHGTTATGPAPRTPPPSLLPLPNRSR